MNEGDTSDTVAANPETVDVTAVTELREAGFAWAADNHVSEVQAAQDDRRPLPRSLQILLSVSPSPAWLWRHSFSVEMA